MKHSKELQFLAMSKSLSTQEVVDRILQSDKSQLKKMEETHVITLNDGCSRSKADLYRFHLDRVDITTISSRLKVEIDAAKVKMVDSQYTYLFDFEEDDIALSTTL